MIQRSESGRCSESVVPHWGLSISFEVKCIMAAHYSLLRTSLPFSERRSGRLLGWEGGREEVVVVVVVLGALGTFKAAFQGNQACFTDSLGPVTRPSSPS